MASIVLDITYIVMEKKGQVCDLMELMFQRGQRQRTSSVFGNH